MHHVMHRQLEAIANRADLQREMKDAKKAAHLMNKIGEEEMKNLSTEGTLGNAARKKRGSSKNDARKLKEKGNT